MRVVVAPATYDIAIDHDGRLDDLDELDGLCDFSRRRIWIKDHLAPSSERDTVLHEILHAVVDQLDLKRRFKEEVDKQFEEDVVYALTPRLLALLRDNPQLVTYLVEDA